MRALILKFVFISIITTSMGHHILAHAAMETHSLIYQKDNSTIVELDVPWTINEAARKHYEIEKGIRTSMEESIQDISNYIIDSYKIYIRESLIELQSIELLPQDHGHSYLFRLTYDAMDIEKIEIENNLLRNLSSTKVKHHMRIIEEDDGMEIMVSSIYDAESFWKEPYWILLFVIGLASIGGIIYLNWKKRK